MEKTGKSIFDVLEIVQPGTIEWDYLWKKLGQHRINRKLPNPTEAANFGECWEYMNTETCSFLWRFKRKYHVFRHRLHPKTDRTEWLLIPVSFGYSRPINPFSITSQKTS